MIGLGLPVAHRLAETVEAEWMYALQAGAPATVQDTLRMRQHRIGGAIALSMAADPTGGYWSKSLGFGVTEPVCERLVADVLDVYRSNGDSVATLQIAEDVLPADWDAVCRRRGLVRSNTWAKCLLPLAEPVHEAPTRLRVGRVDAADLATWARTLGAGFGMPDDPALVAFMAGGVAAEPRFQPWAAWDGDTIVAAANLFVSGEIVALAGASTLPGARGQGAQSALTRARLLAAREIGARWASFETWIPGPGGHNPSLSNMLRIGFEVAYERPNWVWRRDRETRRPGAVP